MTSLLGLQVLHMQWNTPIDAIFSPIQNPINSHE